MAPGRLLQSTTVSSLLGLLGRLVGGKDVRLIRMAMAGVPPSMVLPGLACDKHTLNKGAWGGA